MRRTLTILVISAIFILGLNFSYCTADQSAFADSERAVQSLGSRTRAMITRVSAQGGDADVPLRYQSEGDGALRHGDLIRAAEEYGRAEQAVSTLETQRVHAQNARALAQKEISRARRDGSDIAQAEMNYQRGDQSLDDGDFVNAELYYARARASLEVK
jgi:hypothetical protein